MTTRTCHHCKRPGGVGPRELRPYGPGGRDVCAECVFGAGAPAERKEEAERQLARRMMAGGPLVLDSEEQVGPRPTTAAEAGAVDHLISKAFSKN